MNNGKLVIVVIFGLALAAAVFAMWHRYSQTRRALDFWGSETAELVTRAPRVELLRLAPGTAESGADGGESLVVQGIALRVLDRRDVTAARGILNVRYALTIDRNYDWQPATADCRVQWDYALRFVDGPRHTTLVFSHNCRLAARADRAGEVAIDPIVDALWTFFEEQWQ